VPVKVLGDPALPHLEFVDLPGVWFGVQG
jgi:hypothetical protein